MKSFLTKHVKLCIFALFFNIAEVNAKEIQVTPYVTYSNEIINEFVTEMKKEFDLKCIGRGGSMPYDIESICVMFISNNNSSVEEARQIEVKAIEKLLTLINSNEKIRPFLREYPFTSKRAEIIIMFQDKKMKSYLDGSISEISQVHDRLVFRTYDPKVKDHILLFREPYEESKKKVFQEKTFSTQETSFKK